jgi:hypothetical protein
MAAIAVCSVREKEEKSSLVEKLRAVQRDTLYWMFHSVPSTTPPSKFSQITLRAPGKLCSKGSPARL